MVLDAGAARRMRDSEEEGFRWLLLTLLAADDEDLVRAMILARSSAFTWG